MNTPRAFTGDQKAAFFVGANFALFGAPCGGGRPHVAPLPLLSPLQPLRWVAAGTLSADNSHTCGPRSVFSDVHAAGKNRVYSFRTCGCELCEAFLTSKNGRREASVFAIPSHGPPEPPPEPRTEVPAPPCPSGRGRRTGRCPPAPPASGRGRTHRPNRPVPPPARSP